MPVAPVNDIELNYRLEGDGEETIVLVNGLADDLETWAFQVDDFLAAGYRVLRFDNRGIGASSKPAGPYSSRMLADDAKALVDSLGITDFHLMGVSMGGMIAQEYALAYPGDLRSVTFACTYAAPGPFCSRMFAMWADHGAGARRPVRHARRDAVGVHGALLRAARRRTRRVRDRDAVHGPASARLPGPARGDPAARHHRRLGEIAVPTLVLAGEEDILIPVSLSRRTARGDPRARSGPRPRAVTPASGSTRPNSTGPSSTSSDGTERASDDQPPNDPHRRCSAASSACSASSCPAWPRWRRRSTCSSPPASWSASPARPAPLIFLISMVGMVATASSLAQFAGVYPSAGSFITYITRSIGTRVAVAVGVITMLGLHHRVRRHLHLRRQLHRAERASATRTSGGSPRSSRSSTACSWWRPWSSACGSASG